MSHAVASCVCAKNMLYNQTSLKGFSYFSTIYQAFSINSVTSALLKPFIAISLPSLRKLYRSATHVGCSGLQTESLRETLTSVAAFPVLKCCDTSLTNQKLHLSEIRPCWHLCLTIETYSLSCEQQSEAATQRCS